MRLGPSNACARVAASLSSWQFSPSIPRRCRRSRRDGSGRSPCRTGGRRCRPHRRRYGGAPSCAPRRGTALISQPCLDTPLRLGARSIAQTGGPAGQRQRGKEPASRQGCRSRGSRFAATAPSRRCPFRRVDLRSRLQRDITCRLASLPRRSPLLSDRSAGTNAPARHPTHPARPSPGLRTDAMTPVGPRPAVGAGSLRTW